MDEINQNNTVETEDLPEKTAPEIPKRNQKEDKKTKKKDIKWLIKLLLKIIAGLLGLGAITVTIIINTHKESPDVINSGNGTNIGIVNGNVNFYGENDSKNSESTSELKQEFSDVLSDEKSLESKKNNDSSYSKPDNPVETGNSGVLISDTSESLPQAKKTFYITLDYKDGETSNETISAEDGEYFGRYLPKPERPYYTFDGWCTSVGELITDNTKYRSDITELYAKWKLNEKSDVWVLKSEVTDDSLVCATKYKYREKTSSKQKTNYYVDFPYGFDTSNDLYIKYNNSILSSTSMREVQRDDVSSYVYYHWTRNVTDGSIDDRLIDDHKEGAFVVFFAFESAKQLEYSRRSDGTIISMDDGRPIYKNADIKNSISYHWLQLEVHKQTYVDYTWQDKESKTMPDTTSEFIDDVVAYVQIPKE